jgi:hypothetical protein
MAYTDQQIDEAIAKLESGGDTRAQNPNSTASGKYQFIKSTFEGVQKNNPDLPKVTWDEFQKNPEVQQQYQTAFRQENTRTLEKHGIEPTPTNQYIVHFAGAPKGTALLRANDDAKLSDFFNEKTMKINRLTPDMTVGDFKGYIGRKMDRALGVQPQDDQINLAAQQYDFHHPEITQEHIDQAAAVQKSATALMGAKDGEERLKAADEVKNNIAQYGPNWGKAFMAALLGQKEEMYTQITGGRINAPEIGEAIVDGQPKQIRILTNARGDRWFIDPSTGKRLADDIKITSTTPGGSIGVGRTKEAVETFGTGGANNANLSAPENEAHKANQSLISSRSGQMANESTILQNISTGNKKFGAALNNAVNDKNNQAMIEIYNAVKSGKPIDESMLAQAVAKTQVPPSDRGAFAQYIKDMAKANQLESEAGKNYLPGEGTTNPIDLQSGSNGVSQWLVRKDNNLLAGKTYTDFYNKEKSNGKTVQQINKAWQESEDYKAIQNRSKIQADKLSGRKPSLKDGDPVAVVERGSMTIKHFNEKTGKAE